MAFRILGNEIISDQRSLVNVNQAGITTSLNVGNDILMDGASGVSTVKGFSIGVGAGLSVYTGVSTNISVSSASTELASAAAIVTYVTDAVGDAGTLDFVDTDGNAGAVNIGAGQTFGIIGDTREVVTGAAGTQISIGLADDLLAPGSIESTDFIKVGAGLTLAGTFSFEGGQEIYKVATSVDTVSAASTDGELPTALAVYNALNSSVTGDIDASSLNVSGIATINGLLEAKGGLDVTGHAELDTLNVSGLSTFVGLATFQAGLNIQAGQPLGIQTNDGSLQNITHVGVNTGLVETGTESDSVLPTERAVKLYVDNKVSEAVGDSNELDFAGDTGTGVVNIGAGDFFGIVGTANEVVTGAAGTQISIGLPDDVIIGAALTVTTNLVVNGDIEGDGATNISGINSVTALEFYGDGSNLTGITTAAEVNISDLQTDAEFPVPFASAASGGVELHSDAGTASEALRYNPFQGTLSAVNVNSLSDARFKDNVETIENAVSKVNQLRGVEYDWSNGTGASVGVIAQEVQEVYPQLIQDGGDRLTVNYNGLVGLLLQAVKELSAEVEELKKAQ